MTLDGERCIHCGLCYLLAPVIAATPRRIPVTSNTLEAMASCPVGAIRWLERHARRRGSSEISE